MLLWRCCASLFFLLSISYDVRLSSPQHFCSKSKKALAEHTYTKYFDCGCHRDIFVDGSAISPVSIQLSEMTTRSASVRMSDSHSRLDSHPDFKPQAESIVHEFKYAWKPGVWAQLPWQGLGSLVLVVLCQFLSFLFVLGTAKFRL